jgi:hypothetical protein
MIHLRILAIDDGSSGRALSSWRILCASELSLIECRRPSGRVLERESWAGLSGNLAKVGEDEGNWCINLVFVGVFSTSEEAIALPMGISSSNSPSVRMSRGEDVLKVEVDELA